MNLKCGGTLRQRAERLMAAKVKNPDELKDLKKPEEDKEEKRRQGVAQLEYRIYKLAELVGDERVATKDNIERKQARGFVEEDESEEEEAVDIVEDIDRDDSVPYNPKGLPLGWDGKPIPYWLYKLHGLNLSYSCEICGNQTYKGPKVFLRHFSVSFPTFLGRYIQVSFFRNGDTLMACDVSVFQIHLILLILQKLLMLWHFGKSFKTVVKLQHGTQKWMKNVKTPRATWSVAEHTKI